LPIVKHKDINEIVRIVGGVTIGGLEGWGIPVFISPGKGNIFLLQNLGRATEIMAFFQVIFQVRVTFVQIGLKVLKAPPI